MEIYGPLHSWRPVKATDLDRQTFFEGNPVNDSFIIGYQIPQLSAEERTKSAQLLDFVANNSVAAASAEPDDVATPTLAKRAVSSWCGVPANNALVPLEQLRASVQYFCHNAPATGWWYWWLRLSDNSWQPFTTRDGQQLPVWFGGSVRPGYSFTRYNCMAAFSRILFDCFNPPWSPGGVVEGHPSGYDAVLMPRWFIYAAR
jgi:hypothetical protein